MNYQIGIIGFGIVGQAVEYGFRGEDIHIYDKFKDYLTLPEVCKKSEFIFVSVPTPIMGDESGIDLSIVEEVVGEIAKEVEGTDKIVILKSTIVPGTTASFEKKYPKVNFCFNPEFLTEANFLEDFVKSDRCVVGSSNDLTSRRVISLYKKHFPHMPMFQTDTTTAEMVKYMANCYLASKVIFANEMFDICEKLNIKYEEVKKLVVADHRIFDSHLDVTTARGFGGKCFPKDLLALRAMAKKKGVDTSFLDTVWKKNLTIRKVRDWDEIPGAVTKRK
ncbi:UDP-glucose/GDP-mannose dehydrogenase family protein [Candidatus Daviesbacteria bacterium]|nr:UDP-glucose/GDP-mannose dehydrogenase family protein [Candidatus Daviesbacteria bacterium]